MLETECGISDIDQSSSRALAGRGTLSSKRFLKSSRILIRESLQQLPELYRNYKGPFREQVKRCRRLWSSFYVSSVADWPGPLAARACFRRDS